MQNLEVISVNLWNILISLANLVILFWAVKKFLFKPVRKILAERESEINRDYEQAEQAKLSARADEKAWHEQMEDAKAQADSILQDATEHARRRESSILAKAQDEAESIMQNARVEAELERKKAADDIRREIVEVSGLLTEKLLNREMNTEDHRSMIDSFISEIDGGGADE
ncbi:MAG: F0F1 ATP synthase subunit B [Ruminococcaceae bacterium]|nr:F0F1 ATP synthase subunit B [Oscillospiraceae bacterium]